MENFLKNLRNIGPTRLAVIGVVGLAFIGFFIFLSTRFSSTDMSVLYDNLSLADSGNIVTELEEQNIAYDVRAEGGTLLVPTDVVDQVRIGLAAQGLPTSGRPGYELYEDMDGLGTSSFMQNSVRQRALEGELARTIASIQAVDSAQVFLVLPDRELFSRERQTPSASVTLQLNNQLDEEAVLAVQHLVAAAVPELEPDNVTVTDSAGNLLAEPGTDSASRRRVMVDQLRAEHEARLQNAVNNLLERAVGAESVWAEVNVEMDFDSVTTTRETFDPDSQVARSSQFIQEEQSSTEGDGLDPVTVANNLPEPEQALDGLGLGGTASSESSRLEETFNYEISREVQNIIREGGMVRRLSVAVMVDGKYQLNEEGERVYVPRSEEEMEQLAALVRSAVGYNELRGDLVEVENVQFLREDLLVEEEMTFFGMTREDLIRIAQMLVLGLIALLVILLVVRPLLARALEARVVEEDDDGLITDQSDLERALAGPEIPPDLIPGGPSATEQIDSLIDINQVEGRVRASAIKRVGEIVEQHPEEAAGIIRNWIYQEG